MGCGQYSCCALTPLVVVTASVDLRSKEWAWIECGRSPSEAAERPLPARLRDGGAGLATRWHDEEPGRPYVAARKTAGN